MSSSAFPVPARSARREASSRIADRFDVRVLEPSPPAVDDGVWFADDPTSLRGRRGPVVSPIPNADHEWQELCGEEPELDAWCADRWLANHRRLLPVPAMFGETREVLHRLAFYVLSPARRSVNGKIALRYTHRGFGTPFFGADRQVRANGTTLVVQADDRAWSSEITSLEDAATFVGATLDAASAAGYDVPAMGDPSAVLEVDSDAAHTLADWYGFVTLVLERLRAEHPDGAERTRVQLWPEHFDVAIELGDEAVGTKASFGGSPGDENHPEPYLYVAPWQQQRPDPYWTESHFGGARLSYEHLLAADDQIETALEFLRAGKRLLEEGKP